jgi:ABC-type nitrate/sulfonate/bicarbonate transport system substrate-binding protein
MKAREALLHSWNRGQAAFSRPSHPSQRLPRFSFAALATTDAYLDRNLRNVEAAVRAIVKGQRMLRADRSLAQKIGQGKFPPDSAELIVRTIQRDVGFYDPVITEEAVANMNAFAQAIGLSDVCTRCHRRHRSVGKRDGR